MLKTNQEQIRPKTSSCSFGVSRVKSQLLTAPNQITLLRLIFIPFVIITIVDGNWPWALGLLIAAGLSDALDGLLARALHQQTLLGQYLDPLADKLLLSSLFLVLSFVKKIPWKYTVLVFSRDVCIVATAVVLYATVGFRDFRPSIFGKINTFCQIAAVFFVVTGAGDVRSLGVVAGEVLPVRDLHFHSGFGHSLHAVDRTSSAEENTQRRRNRRPSPH